MSAKHASDTPVTDTLRNAYRAGPLQEGAIKMTRHAEQMERDRAELIEALTGTVFMLNSCTITDAQIEQVRHCERLLARLSKEGS